ncbi:MAG TPA: 2-hydroxyacid dehydrogenase [Methylomirabilota bacterium]|jgi:phosphoglycerate dehydrogenase-like enzyme
MLRVAFLGALSSSFADRVRAHLTEPCAILHIDEPEALSTLPEVDVLVTLVFTPAMGAAARRLRLIQVPGAGLDRIDRSAIPPGTSLANVHGHETGIAEYVIGAVIALSRSFARIDASLRAGRWESQWAPGVPPPPAWPELAGRTLGILGYGGIGQALARRARAFGMQVCAIRRQVGRSAGDDLTLLGTLERLHEVLRHSDYLVITLPLTPETQGIIGDKQLRAMKPSAVLVNVSRAPIVDEDALYEALAQGRLAGAALDVWYRYPTGPDPTLPARRPFQELANVLMTPHVSGWTDGTLDARARVIAENIRRTARCEPVVNAISPPR